MIDEKILKEKAEKYLVCFNEQCSKHEHCLRWVVGQYVPCEQLSITCVNPKLEKKEDECPAYRNSQPQKIAKGMIHFYDEMYLFLAKYLHTCAKSSTFAPQFKRDCFIH